MNSQKKNEKTSRTPGYGATWGTRLLLAATVVGSLALAQLWPGEDLSRHTASRRVSAPAGETRQPAARSGDSSREGSRSLWARLTSALPLAKAPAAAQTPAQNDASVTPQRSADAMLQEASHKALDREHDPIQAKIAPDLACANPTADVDVIVQFNRPTTESMLSAVRGEGGREKNRLNLISAARFQMPCGSVSAVAGNPYVAYISPNRSLQSTVEDDLTINLASELDAVFARSAWEEGKRGAGIGVAVIDSGVASHGDLNDPASGASRVVYSESFRSDGLSSDLYGHGTHVAGIVAGNGSASEGALSGNSTSYRGIAPQSKIINLAVLGADGSGADSDLIRAIDRAIELKSQHNIRVLNLSLGRQIFESQTLDPLCVAVRRAWEAGIVVVTAAGNQGRKGTYGVQGYGTINSPGNSPLVITVGSMRTRKTESRLDDRIASYSSKGPTRFDFVVKPDLVAPGDAYVSLGVPGSALWNSRPTRRVGDSYFKLSGTSMATPVVSGAVALLLEKEPTLTPDQVKARLMKTAWKGYPTNSSFFDWATGFNYFMTYDVFTVGAGYLDIAAAFASNDVASGSALSPNAQFDPETGQVRMVHAQGVVWGDGVLWGSGVVWGNGVIWGEAVIWGLDGREVNGSAVLWGAGVVWGAASTQGCGVIWGNGVIWGDSVASTSLAMSSELTDQEPTDPDN